MTQSDTPVHVPIRRCIACGRKAPQRDLVRFVADGECGPRTLVRDPAFQREGRGAYVCAGTACFDLAVTRRAFQRALRTQGQELVIDQELAASSAA